MSLKHVGIQTDGGLTNLLSEGRGGVEEHFSLESHFDLTPQLEADISMCEKWRTRRGNTSESIDTLNSGAVGDVSNR